MTSIEYCPECGHLHAVTGNGGRETALHDSPSWERVERIINDLGVHEVDEAMCAFITMQAYDGEFTDLDVELAATGAPMMATDDDNEPVTCAECGYEPIKRLFLLVEIVDEEDRLLALTCEHCGFEPEIPGDWEFNIRETDYATVHEWYCPECGGGENDYPVWQDYFDMNGDVVSDWDGSYTE